MRDLRQRVGVRMRVLRQRLGLSQEEVAARAGLSTNAVGDIERGKSAATLDTLEQIAGALGVDASALVGRSRRPPATDTMQRVLAKLRGQPEAKRAMVERVVRAILGLERPRRRREAKP